MYIRPQAGDPTRGGSSHETIQVSLTGSPFGMPLSGDK